MSIFDAEMGFWIGMGVVAFLTITLSIIAWALPPQSEEKREKAAKDEYVRLLFFKKKLK